ncbi:uncharacterized protein LOC123014765 [Tribolium madens]|uniref:uncharacterized protein LOC123014765 n=1 Tax=Tribolium madens TaxID=41895 RepID=UPI001CF75E99|nr:uncharacterized protein LOC123014765 [Tribolium madens]
MARLLTFVIFLTVVVAIHGASYSRVTKELSEVKAENLRNSNKTLLSLNFSSQQIRYSLEVYYQLLLYIKENNLLDIDDCPRCKCFSDGICIDVCNGRICS